MLALVSAAVNPEMVGRLDAWVGLRRAKPSLTPHCSGFLGEQALRRLNEPGWQLGVKGELVSPY